jgi:cobalt/nickel transport system permease protein
LCAVLAAVVLPQAWQVALLAAAACAGLVSVRADRHALLRRLVSLAPLALVAAVGRALALRDSAGLNGACASGALLATRVVTAALWTSWLGAALSARALDDGLRGLHVPASLVRLLALTRRFAGQLAATASSAWSAAAMRGGFASPAALARTLGLLAGVVLVRALDRAQRVSDALAMRGESPDADRR